MTRKVATVKERIVGNGGEGGVTEGYDDGVEEKYAGIDNDDTGYGDGGAGRTCAVEAGAFEQFAGNG